MNNRYKLTRRHALQATGALTGATILPGVAVSQDGRTLRLRVERDIQILDPAFQVGGVEETVLDATLVTLTSFVGDGTTEWELYAAKSIDILDDLNIRFVLHEGIMWSDGYGELTAEDVKYTFERVADPTLESPWADGWPTLDHVEVNDRYTGTIVLSEPFAPLFSVSLPVFTGHILCKAAMEQLSSDRYDTDLPAQCGPYRMVEWRPQDRIILEANPDWPLVAPDFDRVELFYIGDEKAAEIAYEAGELDYTQVSTSSLPLYQQELPADTALLETSITSYYWIGMNVDHPKLQDKRVRQAIQHAVDVNQIIDGAYGGQGVRGTGIVPPILVGHRGYNLVDTTDLERARALLEEAGVADGLSLTLTVENTTDQVNLAQIVQANLAEIGIDVDIQSYDAGVYWNLGLESEGDDWQDLQLVFMGYGGGFDPYHNAQWFTCDQVGVWNWQRHCSDRYMALHEQGRKEFDQDKRHDIYVEMQDVMEEDAAYIFVMHEVAGAIHRDDVEPAVRPDFNPMLRKFRLV